MTTTSHTPGPWARTNLIVHTQSTAERGALGIARVFEAGIETEAATSVEQATANAKLIASAPELKRKLEVAIAALREVAGGSQSTGRWLDERGTECEEDHPEAVWYEYDIEEQNAWIDSVAGMAQDTLRKIGGEP